jgi:hypothetical protein
VEQFGGSAHGARLSFGNALSRLPRCPAPLKNEALENSFREARKRMETENKASFIRLCIAHRVNPRVHLKLVAKFHSLAIM